MLLQNVLEHRGQFYVFLTYLTIFIRPVCTLYMQRLANWKYPTTNMAGNRLQVPSVLEDDNYPNIFTFLSFDDCLPFEFHFYKLLHLLVLYKELFSSFFAIVNLITYITK